MDAADVFFQTGVPAHARERSGLWGILGDVLPVRSADGLLSLEAVNYELRPLREGHGESQKSVAATTAREAILAIRWRLIVYQGPDIAEVREQFVSCAIVSLEAAPDEAALNQAFTKLLTRLAADAEERLSRQGYRKNPADYLGGPEASLPRV